MAVVGELGAGDIMLESGGLAEGEAFIFAKIWVTLVNDFAMIAIEVDFSEATIDEGVGPVAQS